VASPEIEIGGGSPGTFSGCASFSGSLIGDIEGTDRHGGGSRPAGPGLKLGRKASNTALVVRLGGALGGFFDSVIAGWAGPAHHY
jgi:hypothetical protein